MTFIVIKCFCDQERFIMSKRLATMLKKGLPALLVATLCLSSHAQGWKFDPRVGGLQEKMANATVKLDIVKQCGNWTGTGVLFHFENKDWSKQMQVVLTVRHLLDDAESVKITLPVKNPNKSETVTRMDFLLNRNTMVVEPHPDSSVDLSAIIITSALQELQNQGNWSLCFSFDTSVLADDNFYARERQLDPVVMIGYPAGLMDEVNLQPIFRRGVYATNPSLDYRGRKEFLLDIPNNGGSSGSPDFRFDDKMYNDRTRGGANITIGSRLVMVGISFDGINPSVDKTPIIIATGPSNNTAWVLKAARIKELKEMLIVKYMK